MELQACITNFKLLHIEYLSLQGNASKRSIEPFALIHTEKNWVLIAYCRLRDDFRTFRLDCIKGYSISSQTFTPHKMTLEEYFQEKREIWESTPDIPLSHAASSFAANQTNIDMKRVQVKPFKVIGISIITTNADGKAANDIALLWNRFLTENIIEKIPNKLSDTVYSMYTDYEGDHNKPYRVILGCEVSSLENVPADMHGKLIKGGNYVKTSTKGALADGIVVQKWMEIWGSKLDRLYTTDYEVFSEKAQDPENAEIDFYIAVL